MTCKHVRDQMADFIGGELSAEQTAVVRDHLASCDACAREARGLQAAAAVVEAGDLSATAAAAKALTIDWETIERAAQSTAKSTRIRPRAAALLRYAAVIAIAFAGGYLARGPRLAGPETRTMVTDPEMALARRYETASRSYPHASEMSKSLLALATPHRAGGKD